MNRERMTERSTWRLLGAGVAITALLTLAFGSGLFALVAWALHAAYVEWGE